MNSYDKALEHLEHATQRSFEPSLAANDRDRCWRCLGKAGSGPSGVCDRCREALLADLPPSEPEIGQIAAYSVEIDFEATSAAISALGAALRAYFDGIWEQFAAGTARIAEIMRERPESGPEPENRPRTAAIGTRWAENDLYAAIMAGEADIHCPRGPINFPRNEESDDRSD